MLKKNAVYKLLALVIAVLIRVHASDGQSPTGSRELMVPLEVRRMEDGCVVTSRKERVKVKLEGRQEQIAAIAADPDSVAAYVNLRGLEAGRHVVPVMVKLPDRFMGLVDAYAVPGETAVTLDREVRRQMKVEIELAGALPVGYRLGTPHLSPDRAVVSGISRHTNAVKRLVIAVDPRSTARNIDGDFRIIPKDRNGRQVQSVRLTPCTVHVSLELEEETASSPNHGAPALDR